MEKLYQSEKQNRILEICNEVVLRLSDPQYVHSIIFADNKYICFWRSSVGRFSIIKRKFVCLSFNGSMG